MGELWELSATEAVDKLRRREVSPLEMLDSATTRIEAVEPKVNALPIRFLDIARAQAKTFRYKGDNHPGWLAGLPIAVKDYNDVAGQLTTAGSPIYANHRAAEDDRTVATLRERRDPVRQIQCAGICGQPYLQSGMGGHPQPLEFGTYRWRVLGRGCRSLGRARGLAGEWLMPWRLAADPREFLRRGRAET